MFPQHGLRLGAALRATFTKKGGEVSIDAATLAPLKLKRGGTVELVKLCGALGLSQDDKSATKFVLFSLQRASQFSCNRADMLLGGLQVALRNIGTPTCG